MAAAASTARSPCIADGSATISAGTSAHGQGHATAFAMLASDRLGIPMEKIRFVQSDTATVPRGGGTGGSRSLQMGGNAVQAAAADVLEQAPQARRRACWRRPSTTSSSPTTASSAWSACPSVTLTWAQVAGGAEADGEQLFAGLDFHQDGATFPFGAHVSVVEVDTDDRPGHPAAARRRGRLRAHPQPAARRGPAARRAGAGHRAGAVRGGPLRPRRPAAHRHPRRLPDADRGRPVRRSRRPTPRRRRR